MGEEKNTKYHVPNKAASWFLAGASRQELEKWGTDPNCIEMEACAKALAQRLANLENLQDNPFNPRTEVSADAKYIAGRIVSHLWILFILMPFIIGLLLLVLARGIE
jgi:hypothetical protein